MTHRSGRGHVSSISFTTTPLAITDHGRLSSASRSASQRALLGAEERAIRIVEVRRLVVARLPVATLEPGVEQQELGQVADGERSPRGERIVPARQAARAATPGGPRGGRHPVGPRAVLRGVVRLGAVAPGVVGQVVVVPDRDHRVAEVEGLGVGIGADLGDPAPVVVERRRHVRRIVAAAAAASPRFS